MPVPAHLRPPRSTTRWVGDRHLLISWNGDDPDADLSGVVRGALGQLTHRRPSGLIDVVPADATLLLTFDGSTLDPDRAASEVEGLLASSAADAISDPPKLVEIPVCYHGAHAPDIGDVARLSGLTEQQVAASHSGAEYTVRFLGFMPGFAYLSGLPKAIEVPRLDAPRTRVPAGSVGIAGDRTGIYPLDVPGGWRLIGLTPLKMFDPGRDPPALLRAGDRVRFISIDERRFEELMS